MKQIRYGVFETNSSSTHSLTLRPNYPLEPNKLPISKDGYIHIELGEFGWEIENYTDQYTKLSYLLTMIQYFNDVDTWWCNEEELEDNINELMETKDFLRVEEEVIKYTGAKGIIIDSRYGGYIDHQSIEYYYLDDFIPTNILDFIFGSVVVHTDNDNH